jgi:hypothetical protein
MKNALTALVMGALIALAAWLSYQWASPPSGTVNVRIAFLDSLNAIANRPPVIEYIDSIVYRDTTIYVPKYIPVPVEATDSSSYYVDVRQDSLIKFTIRDSIRHSIITWRDVQYDLFIKTHYITKVVTETVPMPYPVKEMYYFNWYAGGGVGTEDWRVRGGKVNGRLMYGIYAGQGHINKVSIGIEATILF